MDKVYVVGVGMTRFGRFPDATVKSLTREAVTSALADAGAGVADVDVAFFGNATQSYLEGQHMVPGQIALRDMGFERTPITNVENACASSASAFHLAYTNIRAGMSDVALAVGTEKMCVADKSKSFSVFDGAWDVTTAGETAAGLESLGEDVAVPPGKATGAGQRSLFMDVYANLTRYHMSTFGTTERHLAAVASKNHAHSQFNPLAQYRNPMSVAEVLNSKLITWPLTIAMCAPISDGSAAVLVCNEAGLNKLRANKRRTVEILASVIGGGTNRDATRLDQQICRLTATSAFAEIQQTEHMGFCEYGDGGFMAERGETTIGGTIPINPSGGLECKGHPIGATGLGQIHELVTQLRHEAGKRQVDGARFALAENGGGFYRNEEAVACINILARHGA